MEVMAFHSLCKIVVSSTFLNQICLLYSCKSSSELIQQKCKCLFLIANDLYIGDEVIILVLSKPLGLFPFSLPAISVFISTSDVLHLAWWPPGAVVKSQI